MAHWPLPKMMLMKMTCCWCSESDNKSENQFEIHFAIQTRLLPLNANSNLTVCLLWRRARIFSANENHRKLLDQWAAVSSFCIWRVHMETMVHDDRSQSAPPCGFAHCGKPFAHNKESSRNCRRFHPKFLERETWNALLMSLSFLQKSGSDEVERKMSAKI